MRYTARHGGSVVFDQQFQRDKLGHITRKTELISAVTTVYDYTYDVADRLDTVQTNGALTADYDYDANGNRTQAMLATVGMRQGGVFTGTYDAQDRLTSYGGCTYGYEPNGERSSKTCGSSTTYYRTDVHGHLVGATLPDGRRIEYAVDGRGRQVAREIDGARTGAWLFYGQRTVAMKLGVDAASTVHYTFAERDNVPTLAIVNGVAYRIVADHVGTPRVLIDVATGQIAGTATYDEFGVLTAQSGFGARDLGFAGGIPDAETGLTRFGARDYDPALGLWVSKDRGQSLPYGSSLYEYARGDPINYYDPDGARFRWLRRSIKNTASNFGRAAEQQARFVRDQEMAYRQHRQEQRERWERRTPREIELDKREARAILFDIWDVKDSFDFAVPELDGPGEPWPMECSKDPPPNMDEVGPPTRPGG